MEIIKSTIPIEYPDAVGWMEDRVASILAGRADSCLWFLEHPPLYTGGTSAKGEDLLNPQLPIYTTGRGGQYTYHGPGQRVVYVILDLKRYYSTLDLRRYVCDLERWIMSALKALGVSAFTRDGRIGVWVYNNKTGAEEKIAAIGIRIRKGVAYHGIAINIDPDLSYFSGIIPCGLRDYGVTSLKALGLSVDMPTCDDTFLEHIPFRLTV